MGISQFKQTMDSLSNHKVIKNHSKKYETTTKINVKKIMQLTRVLCKVKFLFIFFYNITVVFYIFISLFG